ncbi:MAG: bifunctional [glutamate--ammonia ligase]-adenylyl-L-tyrosine phosphorylase/[glutamate--ammonia-ligase] adenylyltransferase [Desulfobacteraceae bacterium]|nr:bifunctional [glutamate--ammonia ligase]-adenylyl-L-tyrosine phosphorylase/[glutamate--ammonia-ligase] adenylyltransferase [Desulfobacteraceae bacterium]
MPDDLKAAARQKVSDCSKALESAGRQSLFSMVDEDDLCRVFAFSEYAARQCLRNPGMIRELLESGDLERLYPTDQYQQYVARAAGQAADEDGLAVALRRLRHREMVRIAWRDLTGRADLFETMAELSALADACVARALDFLYPLLCAKYGQPEDAGGNAQQMVVFAMGKLGGRELNFSSDIDLMFAFPEAGHTRSEEKSISNEEFFTRLVRRLIDVIGKSTPEGFVFRVDTRLRPYGDSGPLVMSFDSMENYYQMFGREWERYALVKARLIAGDKQRGEAFFDRLRPFVFRRYLDYGTFESIREMKQKIVREVVRKGLADNIKHGYGGIREIEFFGQVFQLIRGGIDPAYQERSILKVLQVMRKDRGITGKVYEELSSAYVFLRNTENRLQMYEDMQTHSLPADPRARTRLALSMGFDSEKGFIRALDAHMSRVHFHFNQLLGQESTEAEAQSETGLGSVWLTPGQTDQNRQNLEAAGFEEPDTVLRLLGEFRDKTGYGEDGHIATARINRLMPRVLGAVAETDRPLLVLKRIMTLLDAILNRSCYISLLLENPGALEHLVRLARISPWIVSFLSQHPLLLDELLDVRSMYAPLDRAALAGDLRQRLEKSGRDDPELQMDAIRVFKQVNMFRIVAADVTGHLPLMQVSDRLTYLAETILDAALDLTWHQMVERYGKPSAIDGDPGNTGFAVIAYGKLGGYELGYRSDLDLVFLHTAQPGQTTGGRLRPIDNSEFFGRLGQRIIHFLSAPTSTGKLYEIDMRLRPSGNAGILVSHMDAFEEYQSRHAWTWEHQALIKARPIIGDFQVARRFADVRTQVIAARRNTEQLAGAVLEMRERMRSAREFLHNGLFDLKQDPGGIVDIEFLVQFLILCHGSRHEQLGQWTDVVRQLNALALCGIIADLDAHALKQAYLIYRYFVHRMNLQEKKAVLPENRFAELRRRVVRIWRKVFGQ